VRRKTILEWVDAQDSRWGIPQGLDDWYSFGDVFDFLASTTRETIPLYLSSRVYVYAVLVPLADIEDLDVKDLLDWSVAADNTWAHEPDPEEEARPTIELRLRYSNSTTLTRAEPSFIYRDWHDVTQYVELNQKIAHVTDIHWMPDREAYCRVDENGNYQDLVTHRREGGHFVCCADETVLEPYMTLSSQAVVRLFDVTRGDLSTAGQLERSDETIDNPELSIYARRVTWSDHEGQAHAAKLRGFRVFRSPLSVGAAIQTLENERRVTQFAEYVALDLKHRCVTTCSCAPEALDSYFQDTGKPLETTPAFFRAEVLTRYKDDPDKYRLTPDYIACRGSWMLNYDINEENQVHAYLCDLQNLPNGEQLYWKAFNEAPKGFIAERAWKTDFLAEFADGYDPLVSLLQLAGEKYPSARISGDLVAMWVPDERSSRRLTYLVTDSVKEWEDAILGLAKLTVDSLNERGLKRLAKGLGCYDSEKRAIKTLRACLVARNLDDDVVCCALEEVWAVRSHGGVAHRGASSISDTRLHYRKLLEECDRALRTLGQYIANGLLDIPIRTP